MASDPLQALDHLEAWLLKCGQCPEDVYEGVERVRAGLRERLREPQDPLEDAADAIRTAQAGLRHYHGTATAAIIHELAEAAASIARARALRGG